jgi:dolichyl-phosphate beta-glucosyltransferase
MELSIVIPAYNEADRIGNTLVEIFRFLDDRGILGEVVVVDDGSTDGTAEKVEGFKKGSRLRLLRLESNQGKGAAVRAGMQEGSGEYILMSDADLSTPIEDVDKLLPLVKQGYDLAVGSRQIAGAELIRRQRLDRQIVGLAFGILTRHIISTGVTDTQCGFKCFRKDAATRLFSHMRVKGYCFDIEILALARLWGMKVIEVPVRWENREGSKVRVLADLPRVISEIWMIRRNLWRGEYTEKDRV